MKQRLRPIWLLSSQLSVLLFYQIITRLIELGHKGVLALSHSRALYIFLLRLAQVV